MQNTRRKTNRLQNYDYRNPGVYFVTICTKNKKWLFWNVGASIARPGTTPLSQTGVVVEQAILNIPKQYRYINVDNYVIMPNHVHLLLSNFYDDSGRAMLAPTPHLSEVIRQMKGFATKQAGFPIWQKSYHDHVVRNERSYDKIFQYIDNNPYLWEKDTFYCEY